MTPPDEKMYVLNGTRLAAIERQLREARDAAIEARTMTRALQKTLASWQNQNCQRHQGQVDDLSKMVVDLDKRVDSRWPNLIVLFLSQAAAAVVVLVGWVVWLHPLIEKATGQ